MIRFFKILLIYSGDESKNVANDMKEAIRKSNFPVIVTVVDDEYYSNRSQETLSDKIFAAIDGSHYVISFLTKAITIQHDKKSIHYTARPNLWFELGYMRNVVKPKYIKYLCTFPYTCIESKEFLIASDLPEADFKELTEKNTVTKIWKEFAIQLCNENILPILPQKGASRLLFNSEYKTDYRYLFTQDELEALSNAHPENQYYILWDKWHSEHELFLMLENQNKAKNRKLIHWHLLYLFERVVFFMVFPESLKKDITEFSYLREENDSSIKDYAEIYNNIINYIKGHNGKQPPSFYQNIYKDIKKHFQHPDGIAPVIDIIVRNYCGLLRINQVRAHDKKEFSLDPKEREAFLLEAQDDFEYVINYGGNKYLGDTLEVFLGYAAFNLARVLQMCGKYAEARDYYQQAIRIRRNLSETDCFPEVIKLYFLVELYHAELELYTFSKEHPDIEAEIPENLLTDINDDIERKSKTVQFSVPLFQHVMNRLEALKEKDI